MQEIIELNTKKYISNEAINARYDFTSLEIDVMIAIITAIQQSRDNQDTLSIHVRDIAGEYQVHGSTYENIRSAIRSLLTKPFEVYNAANKAYHIAAIITSATIHQHTGVIDVTVSPTLRTILVNVMTNYTGFHVECILRLKSKYAKRFYLLACQFAKTHIRTIKIQELRKMLKIEDKFPVFSDLKRRVIDPAVKEVSQLTDLHITIELHKSGKSYESLTLLIGSNYDAPRDNQDLAAKLVSYGMHQWQVDNVLLTLDRSSINKVIYKMQLAGNKVINKGPYLVKSFENAGVPMHRKLPRQVTIDEILSEKEALAQFRAKLAANAG
jgi:plasmid replication initiation protein